MIAFLTSASKALAAEGSIQVSPSTGSFVVGQEYLLDIVVDGGGRGFTTAESTVAVSSNLHLEDIIFGNCNFSFINTPNTTNPSFTGALLGSQSQHCTAYTLKVKVAASGTGTVTLSKAGLRAYGDGADLLSFLQNGSYSLRNAGFSAAPQVVTPPAVVYVSPIPTKAVTPTPVLLSTASQAERKNVISQITTTDGNIPQVAEVKSSLYTLTIKVVDTVGRFMQGVDITLHSDPQHATTDSKGAVVFNNVPGGLHNVVAQKAGKTLAVQMVNVSGNSTNFEFTIRENMPENGTTPSKKVTPNYGWIAVVIVLIGIIIMGFILARKNRRKSPPSSTPPVSPTIL